MDDAGAMRLGESLGHLRGVADERVARNRAGVHHGPECRPSHELHRDVGRAVLFSDFVDGDDVGMVQRGEDFRFALKARQAIGVGCERRCEDLGSDLTLQLRVRRPIDFPHPTHAELRGDFVDAEAGAGREGQVIFVDYTGGTAARTGLLVPDAAGFPNRRRPRSENTSRLLRTNPFSRDMPRPGGVLFRSAY